jgi:hypothetical protein
MYVSFPVSTMRKERLQGAKVQLSTARTLLILEANILRRPELAQSTAEMIGCGTRN